MTIIISADTQEPYSFRQVTWEDILGIMEEYSKNGYLPPIFSKGTVIWLSEEYESDSKTSRFYYPMQLPPWKSLQMIRKLDCWYADTDLDRREYAEEYQRIVFWNFAWSCDFKPEKTRIRRGD